MFFKYQKGKLTVLAIYVDDIVLTGDDIIEIEHVKQELNSEFQVKDLGELKYLLGMEVVSRSGIYISRRIYILDLLKETGMQGYRPSDTPIQVDKISNVTNHGKTVDMGRYQQMVGNLLYLSHTCPDIAFVVGVVSQHSHDPRQKHLDEVYRILRYLKGSLERGLLFKKSGKRNVEMFTDADWAGDHEDRKFTFDYCTFFLRNYIEK